MSRFTVPFGILRGLKDWQDLFISEEKMELSY